MPNSSTVTFNTAGTYYWQAVYSGDTNNNGASSPCTAVTNEQLTVNKTQSDDRHHPVGGLDHGGRHGARHSTLTGQMNQRPGIGHLQLLHQQHLHGGLVTVAP